MKEMTLDVGIATDGNPVMRRRSDGLTEIDNVLIGIGFHWQRRISGVYPGDIGLNPDQTSPYRLICRLPIETYLECVVGSEMNPDSPLEFLRAHAVISRSWAAGKLLRSHADTCVGGSSSRCRTSERIIDWEDSADHVGFHLCSDDHCQRFQGVQPMSDVAREAIRSASGLVMVTPSGGIVDARFSKCCGGITERFSTCWQDVEPECLKSVADPWCDLSLMPDDSRHRLLRSILKDYDQSSSGGYRWTEYVDSEGIVSRLNSHLGISVGKIRGMSPLGRGESHRIKVLEISTDDRRIQIGKELLIRRVLSEKCLYSSAFDIEPVFGDDASHPEGFRLHGRGWGHGVGLCQVGAARMAAEGYDFKSILSHYYPGMRLADLSLVEVGSDSCRTDAADSK